MLVKAKNTLNFHTYEIIYNVLLYVAEVIYSDDFYSFFQLSLTLNPFFSELSFLGRRPDYITHEKFRRKMFRQKNCGEKTFGQNFQYFSQIFQKNFQF